MNLPRPENHFEYRGWLVDLVIWYEGTLVQGYALFKMDGKHQSTLKLLPSSSSESAVRVFLSTKAKEFIDEWAH